MMRPPPAAPSVGVESWVWCCVLAYLRFKSTHELVF